MPISSSSIDILGRTLYFVADFRPRMPIFGMVLCLLDAFCLHLALDPTTSYPSRVLSPNESSIPPSPSLAIHVLSLFCRSSPLFSFARGFLVIRSLGVASSVTSSAPCVNPAVFKIPPIKQSNNQTNNQTIRSIPSITSAMRATYLRSM